MNARVPEAGPLHMTVKMGGLTIPFPLYSARRDRRAGHYVPRAANNVLLIQPPPFDELLPGWQRVGAQARWNAFIDEGVAWSRHDISLQPTHDHRWWGRRDHIRLWRSPDGGYAVGQAHREDWRKWPRRHRVLELDAARDAVDQALRRRGNVPRIEHFAAPSSGRGWDGRVLVASFRRTPRG